MRLANTTNFPDEQIREIIQFVKPNNLPTTNFDVRVTNSRGSKGYFLHPKKIVARVSKDESKFPLISNKNPTRTVKLYYETYDEKKQRWRSWYASYRIAISRAYTARRSKENRDSGKLYDWNKSTGGYIPSLILSREEVLVHILAHELRHFWQSNHPGKRGKVWGARGESSDRDADAYAVRKTREWRRLHLVDIYREQPDLIPKIGCEIGNDN